jgi:hypothetical protein
VMCQLNSKAPQGKNFFFMPTNSLPRVLHSFSVASIAEERMISDKWVLQKHCLKNKTPKASVVFKASSELPPILTTTLARASSLYILLYRYFLLMSLTKSL